MIETQVPFKNSKKEYEKSLSNVSQMVNLSLPYLVSMACPQVFVIFLWGDRMNQYFGQIYIVVAFKVFTSEMKLL
jgi:hypothetical protein